jgi:uncharacterized membrane protein YoaT (DUF817 family)
MMERRLGDWVRARVPFGIAECVMFVLKQGWACLFGGLMLAAIIGTKIFWHPDWPMARYDALFLFAVATQAAFLWFKLETWEEARVIALFHLTGTAMEWFKVDAGSWAYPEAGLFKLMGVPLFSGFMYACVGSYIARVIRLFDMTFDPYPPFWATVALAVGIYVNFFAHHYIMDFRAVLFVLTIVLFGRTWIGFTVGRRYTMPMPVAAILAAMALWIAENIGTLTGTWVYAGGRAFDWTDPAKIGSWYLLLYVAFVTVTLVVRAPLVRRTPATTGRSRWRSRKAAR